MGSSAMSRTHRRRGTKSVHRTSIQNRTRHAARRAAKTVTKSS